MTRTTFRLMVLLCIVVTGANALAEARAPQLVTTPFVEALRNYYMAYLIQKVDLDKIRSQPKHGYTVDTLSIHFPFNFRGTPGLKIAR
ncbi:MAG: hypothetical protein ACE5D4_10180 [Thermodesulfobacteriota bacterium]